MSDKQYNGTGPFYRAHQGGAQGYVAYPVCVSSIREDSIEGLKRKREELSQKLEKASKMAYKDEKYIATLKRILKNIDDTLANVAAQDATVVAAEAKRRAESKIYTKAR
ncbi:MAG: hypothetical protein E7009_02015 [Alphaproteobacteria bacterium]|nr:hypothetical protein [Alphaproteobacteria bacterium]